jgi:hypothetical protein
MLGGGMSQENNQNLTKPGQDEGFEPCIGCGALVLKSNNLSHQYIGASPGCWVVFKEVLAKEYEEFNYPRINRLTIDTYAAQHPGTQSKQSIKSVVVHLIGLHLLLDLNFGAHQTTKALHKVIRTSQDFHWLEPPTFLGAVTILDVQGAENLKDHTDRVHIWAHAVWQAWQPHHDQIRLWANLDY